MNDKTIAILGALILFIFAGLGGSALVSKSRIDADLTTSYNRIAELEGISKERRVNNIEFRTTNTELEATVSRLESEYSNLEDQYKELKIITDRISGYRSDLSSSLGRRGESLEKLETLIHKAKAVTSTLENDCL